MYDIYVIYNKNMGLFGR